MATNIGLQNEAAELARQAQKEKAVPTGRQAVSKAVTKKVAAPAKKAAPKKATKKAAPKKKAAKK